MAPDLDYALTEESFTHFDSFGICACPEGRATDEVAGETVTVLTIHGLLRYAGSEFHYSVHREYSVQRADFRYRLNVWAFEHGFEIAKSLMAAIESAFPQPQSR